VKQRAFLLYVNRTGAYELVPSGWSLSAALLGPYWTAANGLLTRFVLLGLPAVPLAILAGTVSRVFLAIGAAYVLAAFFIYFPARAFVWRAAMLQARGYQLRQQILAESSSQAFAKYATEHHAPEV
jgi:hypothetical protein